MGTHVGQVGSESTGDDPIARAVHDLRAPLTVIRGLCEVLSREDTPSGVRRGLCAIDGEVGRLADGLDAIACGRAVSRVAPLDVTSLAAAAVQRFRWAASERGLRLSLHASGPAWVMADRQRLARALDNLMANAVRHCSDEGRVRVGVAARGSWVHLRVRDDGPGVPDGDREAIFRPGERGSAPRGTGQGLGLAIARDIAVEHGGALTIDRVGTGAAFRITLPLMERPEDPCAAA